jgi:hypothetical protein
VLAGLMPEPSFGMATPSRAPSPGQFVVAVQQPASRDFAEDACRRYAHVSVRKTVRVFDELARSGRFQFVHGFQHMDEADCRINPGKGAQPPCAGRQRIAVGHKQHGHVRAGCSLYSLSTARQPSDSLRQRSRVPRRAA